MAILIGILGTSVLPGLAADQDDLKDGTLQLYCSEELNDLAVHLAGNYMKSHPGTEIHLNQLSAPGGQEIRDLIKPGSLVLGNKGCFPVGSGEEFLSLVLGRDVFVPIMNTGNPHAELILEHGLSQDQLRKIFSGQSIELKGRSGQFTTLSLSPVMPGTQCGQDYLKAYLGNEIASAQEAVTSRDMISMVAANRESIGFCNLACLNALENDGGVSNISVLPIDPDADGKLSHVENIYASSEDLSHGIYLGKYPRQLYTRIYAIAASEPGRDDLAFMQWMLEEGQQDLILASVLPADYSEKSAGIKALHPVAPSSVDTTGNSRISFILVLVLVALVLLIWFARRRNVPGLSPRKLNVARAKAFSADENIHPAGLSYASSHIWTIMEADGLVRVGLDAFVPQVTGELTRLELKAAGEDIRQGDSLLTLVHEGRRLEVKSPISGCISEINTDLVHNPSLLNEDPYARGWLFRITPLSWKAESGKLMSVEDYLQWIKSETLRLKDFLSATLSKQGAEVEAVLQDGGKILQGTLAGCDPQTWEMFQGEFL